MEFSPPKPPWKQSQEKSKWFTVKASLSPEDKDIEEKPVLVLKPFSAIPHISFNKVKIGCAKSSSLYIHNPLTVRQVVQIEKFPTDKGFSIENEEFSIEPGEEKTVKIVWAPVKSLSCRETVAFRSSTGCKTHAYLLGTSYSPPKKSTRKIAPSKSKHLKQKSSPKITKTSIVEKDAFGSDDIKTYEEGKENLNLLESKCMSFINMSENTVFKFPSMLDSRTSFCLKSGDEFPDSPIRRQTYTINNMLLSGRESEILPFHPKESLDNVRLENEWRINKPELKLNDKSTRHQNSFYITNTEDPSVTELYQENNLNDSLENKKEFHVILNDSLSKAVTNLTIEKNVKSTSLKKELFEESRIFSHSSENGSFPSSVESSKNHDIKREIPKESKKSFFMEIPVDGENISSGLSKNSKKGSTKYSLKTAHKFSPFKAKVMKSRSFLNSKDSVRKNSSVASTSTASVRNKGKASKFMPKKLCLSKPRMTESVVYHRNPFASMNIYYDERWIEKQEAAFTSWLNFILTPNDDFGSEFIKVDSAKLWIESIKDASSVSAPSKEELSLKAYTAARNLNTLRKSSFNLYQTEEIVAVIRKIEKEVDLKRINIRKDRSIHADLGIKKDILEMLLSYNTLWLRIGLETVYGEVITLQNNSDVLGLSRFIVHRFLHNPEISSKYLHPAVINYYKKGYEDEIQRFTLKKFLLLVFFLDTAKNVHLIKHNPCLFNKNAKYKSSREMLLVFSREYLGGEGDITKHLRYLGYKVSYQQTALEEFDYSVRNLSIDLRCGLRLGRVVELLLEDWTISQMLRINTLNRLTKIHNNNVILKALKNASIEIENNIEAKHITDGDREKTLDLLWQIIFKTQISKLINKDLLKKENAFLYRSLKLRADFAAYNALRKPECASDEKEFNSILDSKLYKENEILQLLFQWCQNVCAHYGVKVHNFTSSFSDGRALCFLLHHYHPNVLPYESIKTETSSSYFEQQLKIAENYDSCPFFMQNDQQNSLMEKGLKNERDNLTLVFQKFQEIGHIPILSCPSDMSNTLPDEKVMVTLVSYINIRLMELSIEIRAARKILHAWRKYMLRKQHQRLKVEIWAVRIIQKAWKRLLERRNIQKQNKAAVKIQSYWRMHFAKKELAMLKEKTNFEVQAKNAILIQAVFRGFSTRKHIFKCHQAAVVIQTYFRRWLAKSHFIKVRNSVLRIQQNYRARVIGRTQRLQYVTLRQCIIKLQAYARGMLIRRHFKKLHLFSVKIQAYVRMWLMKRKYNKIRNACIAIQQKFRGYLLTEFYSQEYQNHRTAVIIIQRWYRSVKLQHHKIKCIVKIQACVRRYIMRKKYLLFLQSTLKIQIWWRAVSTGKKIHLLYKQTYKSIVCIQSFIRQCIASRRYNKQKKSVTIIQKYCRAFIARKRFCKLKENAIIIQNVWRSKCLAHKTRSEYLSYRKKVVLVQSVVRRFIAVHNFKKKKQAAITLQKNFRAFILRKKFCLLKSSTACIQRKWRAITLSHQVRADFLMYKHYVVFIQSIVRQKIAFRNFKAKKQSAIVIQKYTRMLIARNWFLKLKQFVIIIQNRWHSILLGRKLRKYFLLCQKAAIKIQSTYRMYHCKKNFQLLKQSVATVERYRVGKMQRKNYITMKQCTIKLQSSLRCLINRKKYLKTRKSIVFIQACSRKFIQRKKYLRIRASIIKIQRYYLSYQLMCNEKKNYLTIKKGFIRLQALYRGQCVRKNMKFLNKKALIIQNTYRRWKTDIYYKKLRKSCIIIQERYRAKLLMKKQYNEFIKIKNSSIKIQAFIRCYIVHSKYKQFKSSVIKIQSYVRMVKCYKMYQNMQKAAVTIQQFYRSYKCMKKIQNDYIQKRLCVIRLQTKVRSLIARKKFLKQKKDCILIQSLIRMFFHRKEFLKTRKAAILIQNYYRNQCIMKAERNKYIQLRKSIIILQSHVRSMIVRKKFLEQKQACILIQSFIRMHIQHKKYIRTHNATISIQRFYRNQQMMIFQRNIYIKQRNAIVFLQSRIRAKIGRKKFTEQKKACILIQSVVRKHIQQKKYIKICNSAAVIQRYYRNQQVMKTQRNLYVQQRKAIIFLQSRIRSAMERKKFLKQKHACILIQSLMRMHLQKSKYVKIHQATILLQKYYRCWKLMKIQRTDYLLKQQATIVLQSKLRSIVGRKNFLKQKHSCIVIQSAFRMHCCRQKFIKIRRATIAIQRQFRSYRLMRLQQNAYFEKRKAIIFLQSKVRSFLAKNSFMKQKKSCIFIQSYFRMYIMRKKYNQIRKAAVVLQRCYHSKNLTKMHRNAFVEKRKATIYLQSKIRCIIARKRFLKHKNACVVIQSFIRMYSHRTKYEKLRHATLVIQEKFRSYQISAKVYKKYVSMRKACIIIQSYFRMYKCRKEFLSIRSSVITIQKKYRATLKAQKVKSHFLNLKDSCIKIQSFIRMVLAIKQMSKFRNACIIIQTTYRCHIARQKYVKLRNAALTLQKYFIARKKVKMHRAQYLLLKNSVIIIQSAIRGYFVRKSLNQQVKACICIQAFVRKYICHKTFKKKYNAVLTIQKHVRAYILSKKMREQYVNTKKCIIVTQALARGFLVRHHMKKLHYSATKIQAIYRSYIVRVHYIKQKESALIIQRCFRSTLLTRKIRREYLNFQNSAIVIQSAFKCYKERKEFLKKRAAIILLQAQIRKFIVQSKFNKFKQSVSIIENYYLAYKNGLKEYQLHQMKKQSCTKIQAYWRSYVVRKKLKTRVAAVVRIQKAFRLWKKKKMCYNMRSLLQNLANLPDELVHRMWFLYLRKSTIAFQRAARVYLLKRYEAATVIQSYFRMWRVQQQYKKLKAAIKIQACWRAYVVRRSITDKKVLDARKKIQVADATESKKLKNRTTRSLELLFKDMALHNMLLALSNLDVCTKLSPKCCERFVASGGLQILIQLVHSCNRSIPHMELIKSIANILLNLSKYEKTVDYVWEEDGSIESVLNLMKIFREKGKSIFTKCCSLLWIFSQDPTKVQLMKENVNLTEQIRSFHYLLTRKQSMEEKRTFCKAIAAKSMSESFLSSKSNISMCPRESSQIDPDWILGRHRGREFEDPMKAITCVMKSLDIKAKGVVN